MRKMLCSCYNLYAARGDVPAFLRRTRREAGSCGLRVFALPLWGTDAWRLEDVHLLPKDIPFKTRFFWHGFAHEPDLSGEYAPMVDLDAWNEPWWARREALLRVMAEENLELTETMLDYCSIKEPFHARPLKFWNPFNGCIQRWGNRIPTSEDDLLIPGGIWTDEEDLFKYYDRFALRLINTGHAVLGDNYRLEIMNELGDFGWGDRNKEVTLRWVRNLTDSIVASGFPREKLVLSTSLYPHELKDMVGVMSFHGVEKADRLDPNETYLGLPPERIEISGDGGTGGDGPPDCAGNRGMSAEQAVLLAWKMEELCLLTYEAFDFSTEGPYPDGTGCPENMRQADVDLFNSLALRTFAEEFLEKKSHPLCTESWLLANEHCPKSLIEEFVPGTEPHEVCDIHKKPEPEPDTRTCWEKYIKGRPINNWDIRRLIKCWLNLE